MIVALLLSLVLQQDDLVSMTREYLKDRSSRRRLEKKIFAHPVEDIEKAVRKAWTYEKREPGVHSEEAVNPYDRKRPKVKYRIYVPEHDPAKRYPVLLTLHGQNGTAGAQMNRWLEDVKKQKGLFLIAPQADFGGWGRSRVGFGNVLAPIFHAMQHYPIDPNRVVIDGVSMGGNGAFQLPCFFPDIFAGAAPRGGGPVFNKQPGGGRGVIPRYVENISNVAFYWIVGKKDKLVPIDYVRTAREKMSAVGVALTYREMDGGHEWFPQENAAVLAWTLGCKRAVYPGAVRLVTNERIFNRSFWIEITGFSGSADERVKRSFVSDKGVGIEERLLFVREIDIRAELVREKNAVRVRSTYVKKFRLYLHDEMLDLDEPVTVFVNGKRAAKKKVARSGRVLLKSAVHDPGRLFTAVLDVKVKK
ncbi:MAG: carboxylesterase family protein [Planctomycetota bacterium]|jgi:predicted esterase